MATPEIVVTVRYSKGGAVSTVMVRDLQSGQVRLSVNRVGTIGSAVVSGGTVYIAGDSYFPSPADAGVQAIALNDGNVRNVIPPGPGPVDATDRVSRFALVLSSSGQTLGSGLCTQERCWIDLIDLATGARTTPVRGAEGSLVALTEQTLFTVNDISTHLWARDSRTGSVLWSLDDGQIGRMFATSDGSSLVIARVPGPGNGGPYSFILARATATTGALQTLLEQPADFSRSLFPELSNDRFAVLGPDLLGFALEGPHAQVGLTLIDLASGTAEANVVTLTSP